MAGMSTDTKVKPVVTREIAYDGFTHYMSKVLANYDPLVRSIAGDLLVKITVKWTMDDYRHSVGWSLRADMPEGDPLYYHHEYSRFADRVVQYVQLQLARQALGMEPVLAMEENQAMLCAVCRQPVGDNLPWHWIQPDFPDPARPVHNMCADRYDSESASWLAGP